MVTQAEQIKRTAQYLGIVGPNEALRASDDVIFRTSLGSLYAELQARGRAMWPADDIPERVSMALQMILSADLAPRYKRPDVAAAYANQRQGGLNMLHDLTTPEDTGEALPNRYF